MFISEYENVLNIFFLKQNFSRKEKEKENKRLRRLYTSVGHPVHVVRSGSKGNVRLNAKNSKQQYEYPSATDRCVCVCVCVRVFEYVYYVIWRADRPAVSNYPTWTSNPDASSRAAVGFPRTTAIVKHRRPPVRPVLRTTLRGRVGTRARPINTYNLGGTVVRHGPEKRSCEFYLLLTVPDVAGRKEPHVLLPRDPSCRKS